MMLALARAHLSTPLMIVDDGAEVGVNREADLARGFYLSDGGITVVPKNMRVHAL